MLSGNPSKLFLVQTYCSGKIHVLEGYTSEKNFRLSYLPQKREADWKLILSLRRMKLHHDLRHLFPVMMQADTTVWKEFFECLFHLYQDFCKIFHRSFGEGFSYFIMRLCFRI